MQLDSMNRGLLGLVLLLTLMLLIQRLVVPFDGLNRSRSEMASERPRYDFRIQPMSSATLLLRFDTASGAVWKREIEADGPWDRLNDDVVAGDSGAPSRAKRKRLARQRRKERTEAIDGLLAALARTQGIDYEGRPEDLGALTKLVRNGNPAGLRSWAVSAIAGYPPKDAVPAFVGLLDHTDTAMLVRVVRALKSESDPVAIEPLRRLLASHPNPRVKKAAAAAIESLEAEAAKPAN